MIRRLLAIALLAIRAALRARVVLALAALLLLALLGLPAWIRGDGTAEGTFAVLTGHTLMACFTLLAATTLWAGCAAMAAERGGGTAVLTAAKPVRPAELWLGKWLGLLALSAVMLLLTLGGLWLQLHLRSAALPADWQRSHRVVGPQLPLPEVEAARLLTQLRDRNELPPGMSEANIKESLLRDIRNRYDVIAPGDEHAWHFTLPTLSPTRDGTPQLRVLFESQYQLRRETAVTVIVANAATAGAYTCATSAMAGEPLLLPLPDTVATPGSHLSVTFTTAPTATEPLFLHAGRNLALLLPGVGLGANLLRAALVLWAMLALLTACGLTLGSCFSFPVASFAATAFVMRTLIGACVGDGGCG